MVLTLTQDPQVQETNVAVAVVLKLYDLANDSNNTVKLVGSITVPAAYDQHVTFLNNYTSNNSDFTITANTSYVWFEDPEIRSVLLNRVTHSGEGITAAECLAVTNMKNWFLNNQNIKNHFDEFRYFKNLSNTEAAFAGSTIKTINLSEITKIDTDFCKNSSLEGDLNIPKLSGYLGNSAFKNTKITSVSNLGNITQMGSDVFASSILLLSVRFPQSLIKIKSSAFEGCSSLEEVIGLENVQEFQLDVFYGITGLAEGFKDSLGNNLCSQSYVSGNANLTSPGGANFSGIQTIMRGVFYGTGLYGYINLPDCVKISGFANNPLITYINAPNAKFEYASDGAYNRAFWNCTGLVGITMATNQTRVNSLAFDNCTSLTTLDFQGGSLQTVTAFDSSCFKNCRNLNITNSDILNAVTIGNEAFSGGVYKYNSLTLSHLTYIGLKAFIGNSALEVVDLTGSNITKLSGGAFDLCNITSITLPSGVTEWGDVSSNLAIGFKSNSNVSIKGVENITTINGSCSTENSTIITPIYLPRFVTGENSLITAKHNYNTYVKQMYYPSFKKTNYTRYYDNSGTTNGNFFAYRIYDNDSYRLRVNILYFKDLEEILPFMFFGCYPKNLIINNTQPPTFGAMPTNNYNQSSVTVNYAAWSTKIFGSIPAATSAGNDDGMTIYVPASAVSTYRANSHYSPSYIIEPISSLNNGVIYATEADWEADGKPNGLIADCLGLNPTDLATFVTTEGLTYYIPSNS